MISEKPSVEFLHAKDICEAIYIIDYIGLARGKVMFAYMPSFLLFDLAGQMIFIDADQSLKAASEYTKVTPSTNKRFVLTETIKANKYHLHDRQLDADGVTRFHSTMHNVQTFLINDEFRERFQQSNGFVMLAPGSELCFRNRQIRGKFID